MIQVETILIPSDTDVAQHPSHLCSKATLAANNQYIGKIPLNRLIGKASFDFDMGVFFKHADPSETNPILPSKKDGVLRMIGSANKALTARCARVV